MSAIGIPIPRPIFVPVSSPLLEGITVTFAVGADVAETDELIVERLGTFDEEGSRPLASRKMP